MVKARIGVSCLQMEQRELRRKEEQAELERKYRNQKATREMYEQSIKLAKQKRDKAQHEEMVCDMKQLEEVMKGITDETLAIQQRKVGTFMLSFNHTSTQNYCIYNYYGLCIYVVLWSVEFFFNNL